MPMLAYWHNQMCCEGDMPVLFLYIFINICQYVLWHNGDVPVLFQYKGKNGKISIFYSTIQEGASVQH